MNKTFNILTVVGSNVLVEGDIHDELKRDRNRGRVDSFPVLSHSQPRRFMTVPKLRLGSSR